MLEWNKVLKKKSRPSFFTCPICKVSVDVTIFNPKSRRYVYKHSRLGKALIKRLAKIKNPSYILNYETNKIVKRNTPLGKRLVHKEQLRIEKFSTLRRSQHYTKTRRNHEF
jgi:hypothetical protein